MSRVIDLQRFWEVEGTSLKLGQAQRLSRGLGLDGQPLAPKKRPDGAPLGGELPRYIAAAPVQAAQTGFTVLHDEITESFHRGGPGPARPILGVPRLERPLILKRAAVETAAQLQRALARAAGG